MEKENPQHKDFNNAKYFARAQLIFEITILTLAILQILVVLVSAKIFLTITSVALLIQYVIVYQKSMFFDKAHNIRLKGLLDNTFNEKRIPNYNNELYYNNGMILSSEIKLLANVHENSFFTFQIVNRMMSCYYWFSGITILVFIINLFISGMDNYSSLLLSFILSSSVIDRTIKLNTLKKISEEVFERANRVCREYERAPVKAELLWSEIIEVLLQYENGLFETKVILSEKVFNQLNEHLSKEWVKIRDNYKIYKMEK